MQVLRDFLFVDGGIIPLIVVVAFAVVAVVVWMDVRRQRRFEDEMLRKAKMPCIHRFVRMVFVHTSEGKLKERYPQCVDCGDRVLKHIVFTEED